MLILNIVLPIFAIILIGYIAGVTNVVPKSGAKVLNNFVFYIALPALLFKATATAPIEQLMNWPFILINLGGIIGSFIVAFSVMKWIVKQDIQTASIYGMNASYGTTGYMGIPLVIAAFGTEAALPAALATLIHNIPVITIVLILCESARLKSSYSHGLIYNISLVAKPVISSPLTISVIAGILVAASGIPLPTAIFSLADLLANASGATALFAIGLGLVGQFTIFKEDSFPQYEIILILLLKLGVQPMLTFLLISYAFNIEPLWAATALVMSALPVGAGVFVFAQKYETFVHKTMVAIVISIIISIGTISLLLPWVNSNLFKFF